MLRGTWTYATLKAAGELTGTCRPFRSLRQGVRCPERVDLAGFPPTFILSPYNSAQAPRLAELTARFPDRDAAAIEALMADHQDEIRVLEGYLEEVGLEERVKEVARLVKHDAGLPEGEDGDQGDDGEQGEDVDM
jgi:nuclear pore complex protein Nup133